MQLKVRHVTLAMLSEAKTLTTGTGSYECTVGVYGRPLAEAAIARAVVVAVVEMDSSSSPSPQFEMRSPLNTMPDPTEDSAYSAINVKKAMLQYVEKITKNKKKNSGGSQQWLCKLCDHVFNGSYTRVYHHLLAITGYGVKICTCSLEKRVEMTRFHMIATGGTIMEEIEEDRSSTFKKPGVHGSKEFSQGAVNDNDELDSIQGPCNTMRSRKVVVIEMFNTQRKDEADDAVAEFFFANGISFNATRSPLYKEMMKKVIAVGPSFQPPGYNKMRTTLLDRGVSKMQGLMDGLRKSWAFYGCSVVIDGWTNIQ